jgi:DNA repair photolyase
VLKTDRQNFLKPYVRKDALVRLEKDAGELAAIGDRREILMSFTTDPYQPIEEKMGVTRKALEILLKYKLHVNILTKAGMRSTADFGLLAEHPDLVRYGATLTFCRLEDEYKWEPFAAPWTERIAALKKAHQRGIPTWSSIEPVIDIDQSLYLIEMTTGFVDEYRIGKLNHMSSHEVSEKEIIRFIKEAKKILNDSGNNYIFKNDLLPYFHKAGEHIYKHIEDKKTGILRTGTT